MKRVASLAAFVFFAVVALDVRAQEPEVTSPQVAPPVTPAPPVTLLPTAHPALPARSSDFWFVPEEFPPATNGRVELPTQKFARGAQLVASGDFAGGLALINAADVSGTPLAAYSRYYRAIALAGLNRFSDALALLDNLEAERQAGGAG